MQCTYQVLAWNAAGDEEWGGVLKAVRNVTVYILSLHSLQLSRYSKETINRIFLDPTLLLAR